MPQGDELNPHPVQRVEVGIGRQLRVEDEFLGQVSGPLLPEVDEAENFIILLIFAEFPVGVAENSRLGVLGQEGQQPLLCRLRLEM